MASSYFRLMSKGGHIGATGAYLTDQAICSAGNFLTSFLAARNLSTDHFGVFALLNILLVFSLTVNNWLTRSSLSKSSQINDPVLTEHHVSSLAGLAAIFGLFPAAIVVGAALALHHVELSAALCLVVIAAQVQETMRRSAMIQSRYQVALLGDSLSYLGQALILGGAALYHAISLEFIFWVMGATSLLALLLEMRGLGLSRPSALASTAFRCWEQGRWILLSGIVLSPIVYGMPWLVEFTRGRVQAGLLSGLVLVLGLSNPVMFSSTWLILARGQTSREAPMRVVLAKVLPSLSLTAAPLVACWALVFCFPGTVLHLFYGVHQSYIGLSATLRVVVLYYLASYIAVCLEVITDTREKSRDRISVDLFASVLMLSAGTLACYKFGLVGILSVGIVSHLVRSVAYISLLWKTGSPVPAPNLSTAPVGTGEL